MFDEYIDTLTRELDEKYHGLDSLNEQNVRDIIAYTVKNTVESLSWKEGTVNDWYIKSCYPDDTPVWTDEHIEEVCRDFYLIPKEQE